MKSLYTPGYRHELKFYLNQGDYVFLSGKLKLTMEQDKYARQNGGEYFIRSLYFDDMDDSAFREKLDGTDDRDKIRLRSYNLKDDVIKLECKHKAGGYIQKKSVNLSRGEADALISGNYGFLLSRPEPFARVMFREFATRFMRPAVIVDYTREAYVFPVQNVRVTFDKDLHTGYRSTDMFNKELLTFPAVEGYDMVMEVKYGEYLPTYIRSLLQIDAHARSAISKYCMCRKFEL